MSVKCRKVEQDAFGVALENGNNIKQLKMAIRNVPYAAVFSTSCGEGSNNARNVENTSAVLLKRDFFTSASANNYPEKYDIFAQVCSAGSYVPNTRLQELVYSSVDQEQAILCNYDLKRSLQYVDSFRNDSEDSESDVVDSNLQSMLTVMAKFSNGKLTKAEMSCSASFQYGLQVNSRRLSSLQLVSGCKAKDIKTSVRTCLPQLISVCGSNCIEMHRLGLRREDCVVPGIVMTGACCQVFAVYLLNDNFPVLVTLSTEMSPFGTMQEQLSIAEWCLRLVSFATASADLLLHSQETLRPNTAVVCLNMSGYFAKPIRNGWKLLHQPYEEPEWKQDMLLYSQKNIRLNRIMQMYEQMRLACRGDDVDVKSLVLFPEGVVSVPGDDVRESEAVRNMLINGCRRDGFTRMELTYRPLILFPRLSAANGWRNDKPLTTHRQDYLTQLRLANDALNAAHVAHLDERPGNIMWRPVFGEALSRVELRLIDFEDAELFDHVIPSELVAVMNSDPRYPSTNCEEEGVYLAKQFHNDFFLQAVSQWVDSAVVDFDEFMNATEDYDDDDDDDDDDDEHDNAYTWTDLFTGDEVRFAAQWDSQASAVPPSRPNKALQQDRIRNKVSIKTRGPAANIDSRRRRPRLRKYKGVSTPKDTAV